MAKAPQLVKPQGQDLKPARLTITIDVTHCSSNHRVTLPPSLQSWIPMGLGPCQGLRCSIPWRALAPAPGTIRQDLAGVCECVCACAPQTCAASRVCMWLIYNPLRKQNCKSHSQIFLIEILVTGRHVVNSREQAGRPPATAPAPLLLLGD